MLSPRRTRPRPLAALLLALASTACGSDPTPVIDLDFDAGTSDLDAGSSDAARAPAEAGSTMHDGSAPGMRDDASATDAGTVHDGGADSGPGVPALSCTSTTPATTGMCGGAHCEQTPEELRADTPTSATCGTAYEVSSLCSLEAPTGVLNCAVAAVLFGGPDTKTCATAMLPKVRSACLDCYVASTDCTRDHCLTACSQPQSTACEECRVREGCIAAFYACSGVPSPYPGLN